MNEDQHQFPDELISAYLDDELSPADRKRVEEQLMDSPDHRRLFAELKALRSSLQELPRAELDETFAARVLRRAEYELLAGPAKTETTTAQAEVKSHADVVKLPTPSVAGKARRKDRKEDGAWRGLVFSVGALAAAVLLMVFSPWFAERPATNVAVVQPPQQTTAANSTSRESGANLSQQAKQGDAASSPDVKDKSQPHAATGDFAAADGPQSLANSSYAARTNRDFAEHGQSTRGGAGSATLKAPSEGSTPKFNPGVAPPANAIARDDQIGAQGGGSGGSAPPTAAAPQVNPVSGGEVAAEATPEMVAANGDVILIAVDLTQEALTGDYFVNMLEKHKVRVDLAQVDGIDGRADQLTLADKGLPSIAKADFAQASGAVEGSAPQLDQNGTEDKIDKITDDAVAVDEISADKRLVEQGRLLGVEPARKLAPSARDVDLLYVVATADQVESLLSDLEQQPEHVKALAYNRSPVAESAKQFGRPQGLRGRQFESLARRAAVAADAQVELQKEAESIEEKAEDRADDPRAVEAAPPRPVADGDHERDVRGAAVPEAGAGDAGSRVNSFGAPLDAAGAARAAHELEARFADAAKPATSGGSSVVEKFRSENDLQRLQSYQGIARRLHLPLEMLPAPPRAKKHLPAEGLDGARTSPSNQPKPDAPEAAPLREQAPKDQDPADDRDEKNQRGAGESAAPGVAQSRDDAPAKGKSGPAPLVRVLFVLRAAPQPPAVPAGPAQP